MFSNSFPPREEMARLTARMLWEIKAVHFNAATPYKLSSGMASPVYIDCRKLISYPRIRAAVMDFAASLILREAGFAAFDAVAGGETAGIPFAALLAERLDLPMIYVRKAPKGHGRNAQIEGHLPEGARVLLIEDLTTAGGSLMKFVEAVRGAGGQVAHGLALFYYDIFPEARAGMLARGVTLHHVATWRDVLAEARTGALFDETTLSAVGAFLGAPLEWSAAHGGVGELAG